jgi:16S rRNA (guanine966-N2)-methyltransferase
MRVISGKWRGRALQAPAGQATRPTSDRAREAIFSMLTSRLGTFEGLDVLDLFAGTGALGIEALSRGAGTCCFIDNDAAAVKAITANLAALGATGDVRQSPVASLGPAARAHHLLFLDPPYGLGLVDPALSHLRVDRTERPHQRGDVTRRCLHLRLGSAGRAPLRQGVGAAAQGAGLISRCGPARGDTSRSPSPSW